MVTTRDLARLCECANGTKTINLAVKRHISRFPERFMFRLNEEESRDIWFQVETKYGIQETRGGKYKNQYHNLTIKYSNLFHDRYFIIDNNEVYHCGASINHAGARTFSINKLEDKEVCCS